MAEESESIIIETKDNKEGYKKGRELVTVTLAGGAIIAVAMLNPELGNEIVKSIADTDPEIALNVVAGLAGSAGIVALGYGAVEGAKVAGRGIVSGGRAVGRVAGEIVEEIKGIPDALSGVPEALGKIPGVIGNATQEVAATGLPVVREARNESREAKRLEEAIPKLENEVKELEQEIDLKVAAIGRIDTHISDLINHEHGKLYARKHGKEYYRNDAIHEKFTNETDAAYYAYRDRWVKLCIDTPELWESGPEQFDDQGNIVKGTEAKVIEVRELAEAALAVRLLAAQNIKHWREQVGEDFARGCEKVQYLIVRKVFPKVWEGTVKPHLEAVEAGESDPAKRYKELVNKKNGLLQRKMAYDAIYDNAIEAAGPLGHDIAFNAQARITFDGVRKPHELSQSRSKAEDLMTETKNIQIFESVASRQEGIVREFIDAVIVGGDENVAKYYRKLLETNPREARKQFMDALVTVNSIKDKYIVEICEDLKIDPEEVRYKRRNYKSVKAQVEAEPKVKEEIPYAPERLRVIIDNFSKPGNEYNAVFYSQAVKGRKGVIFADLANKVRQMAKDNPEGAYKYFMELLEHDDSDQAKKARNELVKIKPRKS